MKAITEAVIYKLIYTKLKEGLVILWGQAVRSSIPANLTANL